MPVRDLLSAASGTGGATDPYFYDVTLLLNGDGTNGAQNNTFLDSSTNNFTITRNGNTTQGSFSPYGNLWSNYFNGSSYLVTGSSIGSLASSFTFEAWTYMTGTSSQSRNIWCLGDDSTSSGFALSVADNGAVTVTNNGSNIINGYSAPSSLNQWVHWAAVRSGSTVTIYRNGTSLTTVSMSNTLSGVLYTGVEKYSTTFDDYAIGYISNLRVTNTAVYTTTFTPSTTPLTAVSGTQVLSCQSNRFIDNSSNAYAITVNGTPSVQRFSPFNPTAPYSTSVIGGSGYFGSSGDYLTAPANAAFQMGSGDFTIEAWIYPTATAGSSYSEIISYGASGQFDGWHFYQAASTNVLSFGLNYAGLIVSSSAALTLNTWTHVAVTRSGTTFKLWINGVNDGTATSVLAQLTNGSDLLYVGTGSYSQGSDRSFTGYISNTRVVKGSAVYTTTFTPPTAPLTAISGTSVLNLMTNAGIPDLAMQNNLETVGNAQVSTSVVKYGTGSLSFDGNTGYLTAPNKPVYQLGAGDFTIECWINFSSLSTNRGILYFASAYDSLFSYGLQWASNTLYFWYSTSGGAASYVSAPWTPSTGTWYYLTVTRSGSNLKFFINGTQIGTTQSLSGVTLYPSTANLLVGGELGGSGGSLPGKMNGYIDDLRITNGLARYTSNFTPPTSALPTY